MVRVIEWFNGTFPTPTIEPPLVCAALCVFFLSSDEAGGSGGCFISRCTFVLACPSGGNKLPFLSNFYTRDATGLTAPMGLEMPGD